MLTGIFDFLLLFLLFRATRTHRVKCAQSKKKCRERERGRKEEEGKKKRLILRIEWWFFLHLVCRLFVLAEPIVYCVHIFALAIIIIIKWFCEFIYDKYTTIRICERAMKREYGAKKRTFCGRNCAIEPKYRTPQETKQNAKWIANLFILHAPLSKLCKNFRNEKHAEINCNQLEQLSGSKYHANHCYANILSLRSTITSSMQCRLFHFNRIYLPFFFYFVVRFVFVCLFVCLKKVFATTFG